jgi:hypothetical protein
VYQLQTGRYASRISATWDPATYAYLAGYRVEMRVASELIAAESVVDAVWRSGPLQEGLSYDVRVAAMSKWQAGAWADATLVSQGKQLLPGNVPSISVMEVGGEVRVTINAATDLDMIGYEVRWGAVGVAWDAARFVDVVPADSGVGGYVVNREIPAGTWDILCCARDSVRQYSPAPARATVVVTLDYASFLVDHYTYVNPGLTGMVEYSLPADPNRYFVTEDGVLAATKFPAVASTYGNIAATYHAAQTSELLTESHDFGTIMSGNWQGSASSEALSGAKADIISLATSPGTYPTGWTDQAGLVAKATARYGRVKSTATGSATLKVTFPGTALRIDAIPREENGSATSQASGGKTITLAGEYAAAQAIDVTPIGTTALTAVVDAITVGAGVTNQFNVYIFNAAGSQVANAFLWRFKGV